MVKQLLKKIGIIIGSLVAPLAMAQPYDYSRAQNFDLIRLQAHQDVHNLISKTFQDMRKLGITEEGYEDGSVRLQTLVLDSFQVLKRQEQVSHDYTDTLWVIAKPSREEMIKALRDVVHKESALGGQILSVLQKIDVELPQILDAALKQARLITGLVPHDETHWRVDAAVYDAHAQEYKDARQLPARMLTAAAKQGESLQGAQVIKSAMQVNTVKPYKERFEGWRTSPNFRKLPNRILPHWAASPYYLLKDDGLIGLCTPEQGAPGQVTGFLPWYQCAVWWRETLQQTWKRS